MVRNGSHRVARWTEGGLGWPPGGAHLESPNGDTDSGPSIL